MTDAEILELAGVLTPMLVEWLAEQLTGLDIDPRDAVLVMATIFPKTTTTEE
jgi:hypothetical protein